MKKILISLLISLSLLSPLALTGPAAAVTLVPQCGEPSSKGGLQDQSNDVCGDVKAGHSTNPAIKIIKTVIEIVSYVVGVAAVILIIISGLRFVTSGGDSQKVSSAKAALTNALIGILIAVLAQTLVVFVLDRVNK